MVRNPGPHLDQTLDQPVDGPFHFVTPGRIQALILAANSSASEKPDYKRMIKKREVTAVSYIFLVIY
jgi:hypothetical protein